MAASRARPIAIYYEHPHWFVPLFTELERRGTPHTRLDAAVHRFDPADRPSYALVFNRMSPSAWLRGHGQAVFYTHHFLGHLEQNGVRVVNGARAFVAETSKALQMSLLDRLGLPYPRTRVINHPAEAPDAADLEFGPDQTALVQEFIPAEEGRITRVEVLGGRFLYAIRVYSPGDTFNLCPADVCQTTEGVELARAACPVDAPRNGLRVEGYAPPAEVVANVERIAAACGIEVGGIEYVIDARDGRLYYYDVNALSNFVADAPRVVGFDPFTRLADFLEQEAR